MARKFIFISCGQETKEELQLGKDIKVLVEKQDMEGFLAQTVHSADELNKTVFEAIQGCSGFCAVMHRRGEVVYKKYPRTHRASVWIQQEIALLMYRRLFHARPIPIRVFSQNGIRPEGVLEYSIANPIRFESSKEVKSAVSEWLRGPEFSTDPILNTREALFRRRLQPLDDDEDWFVLEMLAAHSMTPGDVVAMRPLEIDLLNSDFGQGKDHIAARESLRLIHMRLNGYGLVNYSKNQDGRLLGLAIAKEWWDLLHEELRIRGQR